MKTLPIILLCALCLSGTVLAQSSVNGKVTDQTGKALPFVTIGLMSALDSALIKATASDEKGVYFFEDVPSGKYLIKASSVGYDERYSAYFVLADSRKLLPVIALNAVVTELNEVQVTGKKAFVEQHIDRMVVNVEGSIIGSGSTALEVLQKTPGVTVDYQNDAIQLKGKEGVIVQIDGRQTYLSQQDVVALLRTMSSDNISTIELITNPGARYDAQGNSGIINIRLKKNSNFGTNGALTVAGGSGRFHRERASLQLNNRTSKLNLFGSYSINRGGNYFDLMAATIQPDPTESETGRQNYGTSTTYLTFKDLGQNAKAGIDFSPSKNTILGVVWTGLWSSRGEDGPAQSKFSRTEGGPIYLQADTHKTLNSLSKNNIINLNAQQSFGEKGQLSADLDYGQFNRDFTNDLLTTNTISPQGDNSAVYALFNVQPTTIKIRTAKADYSRGLANGWKLETGLKIAKITTDNNLTVRDGLSDNIRMNPELSNHFIYSEQVSAAYGSVTGGIGKIDSLKTKVQIGLRVEHTRSEGNSLTLNQVIPRNYVNFFPSIFIARPLSHGRSLSLSYSYRINRPNYENMNPARSYADPYTFRQGNAFLKPEYTSALELRYGLENGVFISIGANLTTDLVNSIFYGLEGNKRYIIWENVGDSQGYSLTAGFPITVTKGWQIQTTAMGYINQYQLDYENESIRINNLAGRVNVNNSFVFGKGWTGELSGWLSTPATRFLNTSPWLGSMDMGIQKAVSNTLKVKFSLQDVFRTNRWVANMNVPGKLVANTTVRFDTRVALLNLTYTFGNQKVKAARQRRLGSEDETKRAN